MMDTTGPAAATPPTRPVPRADWRRLGAFLRHFRAKGGRKALFALAMQTLSLLTEGISILLLVPILGIVARSDGALSMALPETTLTSMLGLAGVEVALGHALVAFVALIALATAFNRFQSVLLSDVLIGIVNSTRLDLLRAIARARWEHVARMRAADLTHLLIGEVDRLSLAAGTVFNVARTIIALGVYTALSVIVSLPMALSAAVLGLAAMVLMRPIRRGADHLGRSVAHNRQEQYRIAGDLLAGLSVVKALNVEARSVGRLTDTLERMRHDALDYARLSSLGRALFQVFNAIGAALFVWVALVVMGMPLAEIVVLLLVLMRAAPKVILLQQLAEQVLVNLPAFDAVQAAVKDLRDHAEPSRPEAAPPRLAHALCCEGVGYRYPGKTDETASPMPALEDVTLRFAVGEVTALTGPSGSGKSTLGALLIGLAAPSAGRITIDGRPLGADQLRPWRDQVGFVPQDTFLMHDTIAANLRLAWPDASEATLWEALEQAQARAFVAALPEGLGTVVGDRGERLSGGERQRIALARALLRRPRLLVLDEATSALDAENQTLIAASITELKRDMAIVTIAHRPSMIALADQVVTLRSGRVVESRRGGIPAASSEDRSNHPVDAEAVPAFD